MKKESEQSSGISLDPHNANRGTSRGKQMVETSLEKYGAGRSILVDKHKRVIAGNKTFEQAKARGLKVRIIETTGEELIVVQRTDLDLNQKKAQELAIADNRSSEVGLLWDPEVLASLQIDKSQFFSDAELKALLVGLDSTGAVAIPPAKPDKAAALAKKWGTKLGQVWIIGDHRLMCGDSLKAEDVKRLMNGEKAKLCATDPPYLVSYDAKNHPQHFADKMKNPGKNKEWNGHYADKKAGTDLMPFYCGFLDLALDVCTPNAGIYVWHAMQRAADVQAAMEASGILVHQQIIWFKNKATLGHSFYMWAHEPCLFGWKKGYKPRRNGGGGYPSTVWQVDVPTLPGKETRHPTEKPTELFVRPMKMHTSEGDLCYEPFSGSGTSLASAQSIGRRCYAMELAPGFAAVALERMTEMGLEPKLSKKGN